LHDLSGPALIREQQQRRRRISTDGVCSSRLGVLTCGLTNILSIIEGVIYLTKSDEDFVRTYIQNKKGWF
jgi:hypothetical protein